MIRVLIDTPPFFIRPLNTDWRYMRSLAGLSAHAPLQVELARSRVDGVVESARYIRNRLIRNRDFTRRVGLVPQGADVAICHRDLPLHAPMPVVWMYSVADPRMQNGVDPGEIERQYESFGRALPHASMVQVVTPGEAARHAERFPAHADRFVSVPFFLPYLTLTDDASIVAKHEADDIVRILLVGHEAHRKGLDRLIAALATLPSALQRRIELDVVSRLTDIDRASIAVPADVTIRWHELLDRGAVAALFAAAHVYAMPSRYETYGLTFVEAMAAGAVVIAPDWEAQRDLTGHGAHGINVDGDIDGIAAAIRILAEDRGTRMRMALAAGQFFGVELAPHSVARRYAALCRQALARDGGK